MGAVQPLRRDDPRSVGGFLLLGRLGAGGMGVVYLARSTGGTLVALKVIRAEYTDDTDFRVRFRREAEAAARLTGPWLVPVREAAPEAPEPWLATAFVPGPSLADAVRVHGPLPVHSVRVLGTRLAEALTEVHTAGLVHRDVKPGNVLLALDGPRLIDFGIARSAGSTALTESGVVIGSPGFLSPEQAQSRADIGPPSDVFSLGCVLVYAATGGRPFGTGSAPAVLFRTVHEPPDLSQVPSSLVELLTECLAKDPASRPTTTELRGALAAADDGPWLPAELPRLIAEHSARVLTLPDPEPEASHAPTRQTAPDRSPLSRRRLLALGSAAGVVTIGGGLAAWNAVRNDGTPGSAPPSGKRPRYVIGLHGDLSGRRGPDGTAQERGARLAVDEFNARTDRGFDLALKVRDDGGDAGRAREVAAAFAADQAVYAVIGPTGDAEAETAAPVYEEALLPVVALSPGTDTFTIASNRVLFQLRPNDNILWAPLVRYLTEVGSVRRTAVVDDRATPMGSWMTTKNVSANPPSQGSVSTHVIPADSEDFGPVAAAVLARRAEAVVYGGTSPHRAALCARALRGAGFTGICLATQPVLEKAFLTEAGGAAEKWVISATYVDPAELPRAEGFVASYLKRFGVRQVGRYAMEAYDAVFFLVEGLGGHGERTAERGALVRGLRSVTYRGLAKTVEFPPPSQEFVPDEGLFLYRVEKGGPHFLGQYAQVVRG
ncbi:bifunctional serine/threonine-protein kinase/ABC transporter substrate-binding protein [Streptomyces sp. NPDC102274]|uniref:bifunctional serine/threonine-protein kinase/ABC transporter substrate-binding protein n=1 Tax=Streptomyces sp. NPDC102274 TaxID=3366151 RepID=UPI00380DAB0C